MPALNYLLSTKQHTFSYQLVNIFELFETKTELKQNVNIGLMFFRGHKHDSISAGCLNEQLFAEKYHFIVDNMLL